MQQSTKLSWPYNNIRDNNASKSNTNEREKSSSPDAGQDITLLIIVME